MIDPMDFVTTEGGLSLLLLEGVFFVPLAMAALFFPGPALIGLGALTVLGVAGLVVLRRRKR